MTLGYGYGPLLTVPAARIVAPDPASRHETPSGSLSAGLRGHRINSRGSEAEFSFSRVLGGVGLSKGSRAQWVAAVTIRS